MTLVTAGRVGKPHGRDGSFWVEAPSHPLSAETRIVIRNEAHTILRRAGTDDRPLIRVSDIHDPSSLRGELLLVDEQLGDEEWLASDLLHCFVPGHGRVVRVMDGTSCSVLELSDGALVPFVSDAIRSVQPGEIVLNEDFLG